jgi:hypothetical protein
MLVVALALVAAGCSEKEPGKECVPVSKALEEVSSLSNIKERGVIPGRPNCIVYAGAQIFTAIYQGERTYYLANGASSMSTCGFIVYDCFGDEIINSGTDNGAWNAYYEDRAEEELLWTKK